MKLNKLNRKNIFCKLSGLSKGLILILTISALSSCGILNKGGKSKDEDPRIKNFNFNYHFLEANKQKALGNFDEALREYSLALKVDETQAAVCYEISGILSLSGDYSGAVEYAEKAVKLDQTENEYYKLLLAYVYQINGQLDKSIDTYRDLIKSDSDKINYYFEVATIYMQKEEMKEAIKILNDAEAKFGVNEMISLEKESYYIKNEDYNGAINEIEKLVDAFPENAKYKTLLAETYVNAGRYDDAEIVYSSIDEEKINEGIILFSMADFYRTRQNYEKSFKYLAAGIKRDDVDLDIKVRMMLQLLEAMGNDNYMIGNIRYLLELMTDTYPEELKVRALKSDFLLFTKEYKEAQKEFNFLLEHDKSRFQIWEQALQLDFMLKDMESMFTRSKEATDLFPNVVDLYKYLIISAYATENYKDVINSVDYVSVFLLNDQELLIEYMLLQGDSYHKLNLHHESDSVYESILDKDSENVSVLNNYAYFLAERGEKLDRALELSSKLVELEGNNLVYLDTHAWVLFKNNDYENALGFMQKVIEQDQESFVYFEHMGDIQFMLEQVDQAVISWEKSVGLGNQSEQIEKKISLKNIVTE